MVSVSSSNVKGGAALSLVRGKQYLPHFSLPSEQNWPWEVWMEMSRLGKKDDCAILAGMLSLSTPRQEEEMRDSRK
jgi:hypothetical protein